MTLTQVSTAGVKDDAVTSGKIPANAVGSSELADNAVDTAAIADNAVTTAKLATDSVTTGRIADEAVTLAKLEHGTSSNDGKFLRANNGADPSFEVVNTDLVADTSPQLGGTLDTNGQDVDFKGSSSTTKILFDASQDALEFADSAALTFGDHSTTGDYQISYVNGGDYTINAMSGGSGDLVIGRYENAAQKKHIVSTRAGVAELYHDNSKKLNTASGGVTVTGTCTATAFSGDGSALTGITSFVSGMILLWSGAANAIPSGWVLCDGNNSTPNLTDRFVVGAGNSYSVGSTGGSNTATDTVSISGSDTVNISVSGNTGTPSATGNAGFPLSYSFGSGTHTHSFSGSGSDTVNISGSDTVSIDTRSPYYALCYIMKT